MIIEAGTGFAPAGRASWLSRYSIAALALAGGLVLFGNGLSALPEGLREHWGVYLGKLTLTAVLLLWVTGAERLTFYQLGLTRRNLFRSAAIGGALAALMSVPVVVYLVFPIGIAEGSIDYQPIEDETVASFLLYALVRQPLGTAVFEEVAFRGILQAVAIRAFGIGRGVLATAMAFMLWHVVINYQTIQETNVGDDRVLAGLAQVGQFAGLLVGGLFLSVLRQRTGNLSGPIVFHWLIVVAMTATLFVLSR